MVVSAEKVPWKQVVLKVDHQGVSLTNGGQEDTEESFAFEKKERRPKKTKTVWDRWDVSFRGTKSPPVCRWMFVDI